MRSMFPLRGGCFTRTTLVRQNARTSWSCCGCMAPLTLGLRPSRSSRPLVPLVSAGSAMTVPVTEAPLLHPDATVASAAADARRVADQLGIGRFTVFGHSGGGARAMACGALLPERVLAVVSVSSPAPWLADGLDYFAGISDGTVRELQAAVRGRAALEEVLASNEFDPESFIAADYAALESNWSWFNGIVAAATANGFDGMVEDLVSAMAPWGFDLADIAAPTLIMHGTADRMVPSSHGEWLAAHCPTAELRLQSGAGHISVLDSAPGALAWLRRVVSALPDGTRS